MSNTYSDVKNDNIVNQMLKEVSYKEDPSYIPSNFSINFINFIKLVNGPDGEQNKTPVFHYKMLDLLEGDQGSHFANMIFRGAAKSSIWGEYLILYLAVYGELPSIGDVRLLMYIGDSLDNGVKNMRKNLEYRWENSDFLQKYTPHAKFIDNRWEFENADGLRTIVKGYGSTQGIRGVKEMGIRPRLAILDDLVSDDDARSPTVIASIEDTVYKAVDYALDPQHRLVLWLGTPFNQRDPLYKAIDSGAWKSNVYPICEEFPCSREDFRGAWEDRFDYDYVKDQYDKARRLGKLDTFNQELMLSIISEEERLVPDSDIGWYKHANVKRMRNAYNFYITTDFATSEKQAADFSVINVWALNNNGDWFWVDGVCKKMLMNETIAHLFRLAQKWRPQGVGIEISGQQGGFLSWIKNEMQDKNIFFTLASPADNLGKIGLRPTRDKMSRFQLNAVPLFQSGKVHFPEELRESEELEEILTELKFATAKGFKSKHDDCIDTISMLGEMYTWRPSEETVDVDEEGKSVEYQGLWGTVEEDDSEISSYFV
jgi:predicted phage terminase large subunit-like protein